ncbi:MAG: hypothetical protein ACYCZZ_00020 [Minisyncoccota bacterium]
MNLVSRYVAISLVMLLVIGGAWYALHLKRGQVKADAPLPSPQGLSFAAEAANSSGLSPAAAAAAGVAAAAPFQNEYRNTTYGFSFKYPKGLSLGEYTPQENPVTTILVQNISQHIGFQIYITPWTNPDTIITAASIKHDLPGIVVRDAQVAQIGASSPGVAFLTKDPTFGESRQVWVVYEKHLYQISTYSSQDALLQKVLTTWVFTK